MGSDQNMPGKATTLDGVTAVLLAGGRGSRMCELTDREAKPAIYFGGRNRMIDCTMANAAASGVGRMIVATQYRAETLHALLPEKWGSLFGGDGLTLREGRTVTGKPSGYRGTADAVGANEPEIDASQPREVLILAGDHVYQMDYRKLVAAHRASGAKATVAACTVPADQASAFGVINASASGRIDGFFEKPDVSPILAVQPLRAMVSMGIYVFDWAWLKPALRDDMANRAASHDFGNDILPRAVLEGVAYAWRHQDGGQDLYWSDVGTLDSYRLAQLAFERADRPFSMAHLSGAPRRFSALPDVSDGLQFGFALSIGGLSLRAPRHRPDVADRWTLLSETVLLPGARLGAGVRLSKAIVGPRTSVPAGVVVGEDPDEDARWFRRTDDGTVLITTAMIANRGLNRPRTFPAVTPGSRPRAAARP